MFACLSPAQGQHHATGVFKRLYINHYKSLIREELNKSAIEQKNDQVELEKHKGFVGTVLISGEGHVYETFFQHHRTWQREATLGRSTKMIPELRTSRSLGVEITRPTKWGSQ